MRRFSELQLSPSSVFRVLAGIALLLLGLHIFFQTFKALTGHERVFGLVNLFDLDQELNAPSYFSGLILILASLLLGLITFLKKREGAPHVLSWAVLCAGFLLMGADEIFSYHENIGPWVRGMIGRARLGFLHWTWVVVAIPTVVLIGLSFLKFLRDLASSDRWRFLVAGAVYVGGLIVVEMIGGWYIESNGPNLTYNVIAGVEEGCEMGGVILFIRALLIYIAREYRELRLRFDRGAQAWVPGS